MSDSSPTRQCGRNDCEVALYAKGLCRRHYEADRRSKIAEDGESRAERKCTVEGCGRRHYGRGYCNLHWKRVFRRGTTDLITPAKRRPTEFSAASDRFRCSKCGEVRDAGEFHKNRSTWNGLSQWCRPCSQEDYRKNQARNLNRARNARLSRYGLNAEDYERLLESQGGVCAICKEPPGKVRRLAIDHDHSCCPEAARSCGKCVRALLCWTCNPMLGYAQDDIDRLSNAIEYLQHWSEKHKSK